MKKKTHNILPVEDWLIPSFRFTHVHGIARVFLIIEIILSCAIVLGVLILVLLSSI